MMAARLQLVTDREIAALVADPSRINRLNNDGVNAYWYTSINFFLCGDAWPSTERSQPLTAMFFGYETIDTPTLENGNFGLVRPGDVKPIARALAKVNMKRLRTQISEADVEEMVDEECDDFEILATDYDDPGDTIVETVSDVRKFYARATKLGRGVVMYSS